MDRRVLLFSGMASIFGLWGLLPPPAEIARYGLAIPVAGGKRSELDIRHYDDGTVRFFQDGVQVPRDTRFVLEGGSLCFWERSQDLDGYEGWALQFELPEDLA